MRLVMLSRALSFVAVCAAFAAVTNDAVAQQHLNQTLERRFPEGFCPLDTHFMGTFVTNTGVIKLKFVTWIDDDGSDLKSGDVTVGFDQEIDDISIIEAAEFAANSSPDEDGQCYSDGPPYLAEYTGDPLNNPAVPFYEPFDPVSSECPWDLSDGAAIDATTGTMKFPGLPTSICCASTSVVISGLTPGTPYVIHGRWRAHDFTAPDNCIPTALCMYVTVDDLQAGCSLPVRETTWGAVKALYRN